MRTHAVVADVGGTRIRVAVVSRDGRVSYRHEVPTLAHEGREAVLERLTAALDQAIAAAEADSVIGIGVSMAGPTDPGTGVMHNPPNLPGWHCFTVKPLLEEKFSLDVSIANDATLAALAEYRFGAGRGYKDMIYITVSTGIGGGLVIDGKVYAGSRGFAGEIGHMVIEPEGPVCECGSRGCLESLSSGTAVARVARQRLSLGEQSTMMDIAGGRIDDVTSVVVAEAARAGDEAAQSIIEEAATNLGVGMANLILAFDPGVIVIGGGMSQSLDLMMPAITREVDRHATRYLGSRTPVVKSELADDVSLLGAAALAISDHGGEATK